MSKRNIIVIGASAGGHETIPQLCSALPADFPAAIFIVWHLGAESIGLLPNIINKTSKMEAVNATDGIYEHGKIYVAPPNRHLIIQDGRMRTTKGPKENRFRPAIDPLFRSAAYYHNQNVIGILLSGLMNDGVAGLWAIKDRGGIAIVQDPEDAEFNDLPKQAVTNVDVDYIMPVNGIPGLLTKLTQEDVKPGQFVDDEVMGKEVGFAAGSLGEIKEMEKVGDLSPYSCPECQGVLWKMKGAPHRFRCHRGHAYTAELHLQELEEKIKNDYWILLRAMEECIKILKEQQFNNIDDAAKKKYEEKLKYYQEQSERIKKKTIILH